MSRLTVAVCATLALLALIVAGAPSLAADPQPDPDLPKVDPPETWHLIVNRPKAGATAFGCTSPTSSAYCTLETMVACTVTPDDAQNGPTFCRTATGTEDAHFWYNLGSPGHYAGPAAMLFRVVSATRVSAKGASTRLVDDEHRVRANDVRAKIDLMECRVNSTLGEFGGMLFACGPARYKYFVFYLRAENHDWRIVNYQPGP